MKGKDKLKVLPLLMALKAYGNDFDVAKVLIERIWEMGNELRRTSGGLRHAQPDRWRVWKWVMWVFDRLRLTGVFDKLRVTTTARLTKSGTQTRDEVSFEEKARVVNDMLKPDLMPIKKFIWLWPRLKEGQVWPKRVWIREQHFSNTTGIELTMMNIYFLRFSKVGGLRQAQPDMDQKAGNRELYERRLGELLGHLVKRKVWSWKRLAMVDAEYDTRECHKIGKLLVQRLDAAMAYWLLDYFENSLRIFVEMFKEVFDSEEAGGRSLFKNNEGWIFVLEDIAKEGAHGTFKEVSRELCITLWMYLKHQKIVAEAAKGG